MPSLAWVSILSLMPCGKNTRAHNLQRAYTGLGPGIALYVIFGIVAFITGCMLNVSAEKLPSEATQTHPTTPALRTSSSTSTRSATRSGLSVTSAGASSAPGCATSVRSCRRFN